MFINFWSNKIEWSFDPKLTAIIYFIKYFLNSKIREVWGSRKVPSGPGGLGDQRCLQASKPKIQWSWNYNFGKFGQNLELKVDSMAWVRISEQRLIHKWAESYKSVSTFYEKSVTSNFKLYSIYYQVLQVSK